MMQESYKPRPRIGQWVRLRDHTEGRVISSRQAPEILGSIVDPEATELVLHARAQYGKYWEQIFYVIIVNTAKGSKQAETIDVVEIRDD